MKKLDKQIELLNYLDASGKKYEVFSNLDYKILSGEIGTISHHIVGFIPTSNPVRPCEYETNVKVPSCNYSYVRTYKDATSNHINFGHTYCFDEEVIYNGLIKNKNRDFLDALEDEDIFKAILSKEVLLSTIEKREAMDSRRRLLEAVSNADPDNYKLKKEMETYINYDGHVKGKTLEERQKTYTKNGTSIKYYNM